MNQVYKVRWFIEGTYDFHSEPGLTPKQVKEAFDYAACDLDVLGRGTVLDSGVLEVDDMPA